MTKKFISYIVLAFLLIVAFLPSYMKLRELKEKNRILQDRIDVLTKYNVDLKQEIDRLQNDPAYIEKIARDKLGMIKKGEVLYRVPPEEGK